MTTQTAAKENEMTIWKFELPANDSVTVEMPMGARILSTATQRDRLCVWAEVATSVASAFCVMLLMYYLRKRGSTLIFNRTSLFS